VRSAYWIVGAVTIECRSARSAALSCCTCLIDRSTSVPRPQAGRLIHPPTAPAKHSPCVNTGVRYHPPLRRTGRVGSNARARPRHGGFGAPASGRNVRLVPPSQRTRRLIVGAFFCRLAGYQVRRGRGAVQAGARGHVPRGAGRSGAGPTPNDNLPTRVALSPGAMAQSEFDACASSIRHVQRGSRVAAGVDSTTRGPVQTYCVAGVGA
jgi:hypothetical protein